MNIQIGEVIRTLRLKNDVTQEELANRLGVSAQAVSRWENGACYPDLELVLGIASYFGVSTDFLLCVDSNNERTVEEQYVLNWTQAFRSGEHQKAFEIVNDALKSMPTNYRLMLLKAKSLILLAGEAEEQLDETQMQRLLSKAEDLLRIILSRCHKNDVRYEAMEWMMSIHCVKGSLEDALTFADGFPAVRQTKNAMLYKFVGELRKLVGGEDKELKKYCHEYLYELFFEFFYCSYSLAKTDSTSNDEKKEILERLLSMLQTVMCGSEFGEYEYLMDSVYEMLYTVTGNTVYSSEIGRHLQKYKELPDEYIYRSVFFDGVVFSRKKTIHSVSGDL